MLNENSLAQPEPIQTLGRYRLLRRIGRGGMGDVWLGEDPRLNRQVAIKTLPRHNQNDQEYLLRFQREAQAAAALNHPHILPIHDYGEQALPTGESTTYIVMPYVTDGSLADRIAAVIANTTFMPSHEALGYLQQAAEAIDYAHQQGILHRDIKPGNMLLRDSSWLLLADFGIARILDSPDKLTQTGLGFGTPEYMAPEQAQGKAEAASDTYSLAILAYQLFTNRLPFQAETAYATTIQHMIAAPPSPRHLNPQLSPALEEALLHGLAKQPTQRPATASLYVAGLQRALEQAPFAQTFVPAPLPPTVGPSAPSLPDTAQRAFPPPTDTVRPPFEQSDKSTTAHTGEQSKSTLTRRRVLIGGGSALLLAGGTLGIWFFASEHGSSTTGTGGTHPRATQTTSANPDMPVLTLQGHNKPVAALSWSPTASTLASAGSKDDGQVFLWDIQSLAQQQTSQAQPIAKTHFSTGIDLSLAWSHDGARLAIGNMGSDLAANTVKVAVYKSNLSDYAPGYDGPVAVHDTTSIEALGWAQGNALLTISHTAFSLDKPDVLAIWDSAQHQLASINLSHVTYTALTTPLNPLTVSPHATTTTSTLAISSYDGVVIGDLSIVGQNANWQQRALLKFDEHVGNEAGATSWSSDGSTIACLRSAPNHPTSVFLWAPADQLQLDPRSSTDPNAIFTTVAWSPAPTSQLFAAGAQNGKVYLWSKDRSTLPQRILSPSQDVTGTIKTLAWSADGKWLAAGYDDVNASILIWKL